MATVYARRAENSGQLVDLGGQGAMSRWLIYPPPASNQATERDMTVSFIQNESLVGLFHSKIIPA
jgi:hypothetical protein